MNKYKKKIQYTFKNIKILKKLYKLLQINQILINKQLVNL